jgi:N-acetylmuramoyl-L-alanine amidase
MKICLSPAHTPTKPGATYNGVTEYGLSCAVIGDLIFRLDKAGHEAHLIGSDSNAVQVDWINNIDPDIGLELHFNASTSSKMNGTETLYSGSVAGGDLAFYINQSIVDLLRTRNRGIKIGYYQQDKTKPVIEIIRNTRCPFVVIEPLFLSNPSDFAKIDIGLISIAIFEGILRYGEG